MPKQKRLTVLSMAVLLALLVAAIMPAAALADDGTPPPPDTPVVEEPSSDAPAADAPVVDAPAADAPAADVPVVDAPAADAPAVDAPAADLTVPEVLDQLPEDTNLVVVDQGGEVLPLTSIAAATVLAMPDPQFCPGTALAGDPTCSPSRTTIADALTDAYAAGGDGTIFVASGTFTEDVTIDGSLFTGGGGLPSIFSVVGAGSSGATSTILDGYIEILGMNDFTLQGFHVYDKDSSGNSGGTSVYASGNNGTLTLQDVVVTNTDASNGAGIVVKGHTGNVFFQQVTSSNNNGYGASIAATGDVEVRNSRFEFNDDGSGQVAGLEIMSDGNVTLNNVNANYNKGDGADIYAKNTGPTSVTVTNSRFNYNTSTATTGAGDPYGNGLLMDYVQGDITLNNVTAMYNSNNGVEVGVGSRDGMPGNGTTGNIDVNGGTFAFNGADGLNLSADGNITLNGITTYGNWSNGAELCAGGDVVLNGGSYYNNYGGIYVKCAQNVYSYYGSWWGNYYGYYGDWWGNYYGWWGNYWDNYYGWYGWGYSGSYWGFYDGWWYGNNWALEFDGDADITIENIYVDGYFLPDYYWYNQFYNSYYYGYGWSDPWGWNFWERPHYHGYWYWYPYYQFPQTPPLTVVTTPLTEEELPGPLPEGKTFADAFKATASGGSSGDVTEVSFTVPADAAADATFTVLSWDGTQWTEVPSEIVNGKVVFDVGVSGTFALATP